MSNVLNALGAFERVDEVERTEVFGESFANRLRGSLCVAEVGSDDFEASLASGEVPVLVSVVRRADHEGGYAVEVAARRVDEALLLVVEVASDIFLHLECPALSAVRLDGLCHGVVLNHVVDERNEAGSRVLLLHNVVDLVLTPVVHIPEKARPWAPPQHDRM